MEQFLTKEGGKKQSNLLGVREGGSYEIQKIGEAK